MEASGSIPCYENRGRGRTYVTDGTNILYRARTQRECIEWLVAQPRSASPERPLFSSGQRASQRLLESIYRTAMLMQQISKPKKLLTAHETQRDQATSAQRVQQRTRAKLPKNKK